MSLKLSVSSAPTAKLCSTESLIESIENVQTASESLYDCVADGLEICQVIDNLTLISTALDNGGLTKEFLDTFNSEGETLAAAGVESLSVSGLEALTDDQVGKFEDRVAAGIEGKIAEYWNKFVAWLKNMWAKFVNWFKSILINRAKYVSALGAVEKQSYYDAKATVTIRGLVKENIGKKVTDIVNLTYKALQDIMSSNKEDFQDTADAIVKQKDGDESLQKYFDLETKEYKVGQIFADLNSFKAYVKTYIKYAKDTTFNTINKKIDGAFDRIIKDAAKAGREEDDAKATAIKTGVNNRRELLVNCLAAIRMVNRECMLEGAELLAIHKASNKAPSNDK